MLIFVLRKTINQQSLIERQSTMNNIPFASINIEENNKLVREQVGNSDLDFQRYFVTLSYYKPNIIQNINQMVDFTRSQYMDYFPNDPEYKELPYWSNPNITEEEKNNPYQYNTTLVTDELYFAEDFIQPYLNKQFLDSLIQTAIANNYPVITSITLESIREDTLKEYIFYYRNGTIAINSF